MTLRPPPLTPWIAIVAALLLVLPERAAPQAAACCTLTAVDAQTGTATARDKASGNVFEFRARTPAMLASARVGQPVHANFQTNRVSLDGRVVCCTITKAPTAAAAGGERAPTRIAAGGVTRPTPADRLGTKVRTTKQYPLPQITYGEPIPAEAASARTRRFEGKLVPLATRTVEATVGGRRGERTITHIRGVNGIRNSRLPGGAKRLLEMHVRKLKMDEAHYYLVDEQLAQEWAATHQVPDEVQPKEESSGGGGGDSCGELSWGGLAACGQDAEEAVQDVGDAIAAEYERNRKKAEDWWDESTEKLADAWNEAANCFTDHPFEGPNFPVRFSTSKSMTIDMSKSDKGSSGQAVGKLTLNVPVQGDFDAQVNFLYIPCLPFAFRPSRVTADGEMTVGHEIAMELGASGAFKNRFTIPPTGGPQIVLYVIPIVIGNVPVAVIDVSLYIEGEVDVAARGKVTGEFSVANSHRSRFSFRCSASGCDGISKGSSTPTMTEQSAKIEGQASVQPGIFVALQLSFDYNVLQGRAGPQPYLLGYANGCAAGSITQASGSTVSTESHALTADVDWSVKLRAEALSGGKRIGKRWDKQVMDDKHLWFKDLAPGGSTAFVPTVVPPAEVAAGQPATVLVRMPTCYPYPDDVHYRVTWTGDATPAPLAACSWSAGTGRCRYAPGQPLPLRFTWQTAGSHTVTVQAVRDEHERTFSPTPAPATVTINVGGTQ